MSLNKGIEHKKEYRKPYYGCEAYDKSCRPHGSDYWMYHNRKHKHEKRDKAMVDREHDEFRMDQEDGRDNDGVATSGI